MILQDKERIEALAGQVCEGLGVELVEVQLVPGGHASRLSLFIHKPGHVTVADCERVSRELDVLLAAEGFGDAVGRLEVSSPGLDRPLRTERDFLRNVGQKVRVIHRKDDAKNADAAGTLIGAGAGFVELETSAGPARIGIDRIVKAVIDLEF